MAMAPTNAMEFDHVCIVLEYNMDLVQTIKNLQLQTIVLY